MRNERFFDLAEKVTVANVGRESIMAYAAKLVFVLVAAAPVTGAVAFGLNGSACFADESQPANAAAVGTAPAAASADSMPTQPSTPATASKPSEAAGISSSKPADEGKMIQLSFRGQVELKTLIQFVSSVLGMNIHYDESIAKKQITILSPGKIPKDSLLGLLQSVLKMSDLALVDAEQSGWKKIVAVKDLTNSAELVKGVEGMGDSQVAAEVFELKYASPDAVSKAIAQYLTKTGGTSQLIPEQRLLIVTDFAGNLRKAARIIELIDKPDPGATVKMVQIKNVEASELSRKLTELLRQQSQAGDATKAKKAETIVNYDARTNQLILFSQGPVGQDVLDLIASLDVPSEGQTRQYVLKHVSPQRVDKLVRELCGAAQVGKEYRSAIDESTGIWVVTASPRVHQQIEDLCKQMDKPGGDSEGGLVKFYKLMNTTAAEVLATIKAIEGQGHSLEAAMSATQPAKALNELIISMPKDVNPSTAVPADSTQRTSARTGSAVITSDPNTNSIIVIAPPSVQKTYAELIKMMDKRRPQVMIEVTLVTLDTSNGKSVGVEITSRNNVNFHPDSKNQQYDSSYLTFSSYGLSTIDLSTGIPTIIPSAGFNGVLIDPKTVNVVVKALATSGKAKVLSVPKVLVNDNATATLSSVSEAPYSSINASSTVSTTSFGGYATAGTTVSVVPHISQDDYLQLKYNIALSSFGKQTDTSLPPPRQTNNVTSEITIPDGYAVIVGGLTRQDSSKTSQKLPWIGDIPGMEYIMGSTTTADSKSTLFVFIRPVIMRSDQFEDLKFLSEKDLASAGLPANMPSSSPVMMR